jgi:hypothetical protein
MPRPKNGYVNAAGQPIPGTHDPISRFMDQTALKMWAYKRGQQGLPLYGRADIDIGSTVHGMAELDLKGCPDRQIEGYAHECLTAPDHLRKAFTSFAAFRAWRQQCQALRGSACRQPGRSLPRGGRGGTEASHRTADRRGHAAYHAGSSQVADAHQGEIVGKPGRGLRVAPSDRP